jgi:hypothetical protein
MSRVKRIAQNHGMQKSQGLRRQRALAGLLLESRVMSQQMDCSCASIVRLKRSET